ncbi:hypothetical protein KGM_208351 [Danaus plexippus plexippus]|uniref:Uncharacterized protein n=1 Tax=Danaus plexippus plexippus TaxID=278856 RepID=A0A212F2B7_DANPL|nr:hypothetical protein KGM_208351 [Danaus plexippus plexippus]
MLLVASSCYHIPTLTTVTVTKVAIYIRLCPHLTYDVTTEVRESGNCDKLEQGITERRYIGNCNMI